MTTIAELQVKVDSTQVENSTKALNAFATAAEKAAKARKALNDANNAGGGGGGGGGGNNDSEVRKSKNLSEAIDAQVRKLANLERQRKALNDSPLKTEDPEKYKRLNQEIDARTELVRRQGNSLDRLAAQAKKEQDQRQRAADAAKRIAEKEARDAQQKEEREARFAAAQEKRLNATLGSLSRQIKAVEEYNRTLATLNAARAPTTGTASLGQAQYETYVKLAQATRDAALAQADNSKEIERAQRAYDSSVASLGKVERAQALYAKNLRDSDKALALGLITQEQYNAKLTAFATKRDSTIAAANNNADAEARLAAQLRNVLSAYDPVLRATDAYNNSVKALAQGLQNGKVSVEQFNKALTDQRNALEAVKASQSNSPETQARNYQAALDRLLPLNAQLRNLNEAERILTQTRAAGHLTTEQQIKDYERATKAIAAERAEIERKNLADKRGNSAKQDAAALRGLPAQFTDVVVSLQGGQAPLTVLLQQGGQIKDLFGGVGQALKAVGGFLLGLISPLSVAIAAVGTLGYAFFAASAEITEFNKASASTNNYSGATIETFQKLQKSVSDVVGTMSLAAEVLTLLEKSGKVTADQFEDISIAVIKFSRVTGKSVSEIVDEFASLGKDPVSAIVSLDEKYKFLTGSVYLQIAALERQGKTMEATRVAQDALSQGVSELADNILPKLGNIETIWIGIKDAIKYARDELINWGRESADVDQARLDTVNKELGQIEKREQYFGTGFVSKRKAQLELERDGLVAQIAWNKEINESKEKQNSLEEKARQTQLNYSRQAETTITQNISQVKRYEEAITSLKQKQQDAADAATAAGGALSADVIERGNVALAALQKKLKDAQEQEANAAKDKTTPLDTTGIQDVKSNLSVLLSEYDGYYKKATALGQANVVSAEATKASQIAILKSEATAVTEEYDKQIAAIKKLQAQKGNNAAQNISLTNQLTRAEDQRTKFVQDNAAKQQKVEIEAQAVIDKRVRSVKAYVDALNDQIDAERRAGERAVKAVSGSDSENALNDKLSANDDRYVADQKKLADQLAEGAINAKEYRDKLAALGDAYSKMSDTIKDNAENIKLANEDWQAGATRGFKQYIEEGQNAAKLIEGFVKDSLDSMTDALSTFVLTGKLDFKSLASSIISDLTKIAVKIAFTQALSTIFGGFGGVSTGAISGFSETISTPYAQAKGGGWSQGTQFFAKGGAFTNGIVNSATSFGMSGGGQGVMGEAGPEAIVPLARAADGSLGVRMIGGAQEGGAVGAGGIYININIASDGQVDTTSSDPGLSQFGKELGDFVDRRYKILLAQDLKDGGAIKTSIRQQ